MIDALRKRLNKDEEGFTLIELMVVVLIIGILVAIAVPTFLNAQNNAKSKAAQSNARSALSAAKTVYADKENYDFTLTDLQNAEPSLIWQAEDAPSGSVEQVSWNGSGNVFMIAVLAKNGDCFFIKDDTTAGTAGGTYFGKSTKVQLGTNACDVDTTPGTAFSRTQATGWAS